MSWEVATLVWALFDKQSHTAFYGSYVLSLKPFCGMKTQAESALACITPGAGSLLSNERTQ